MKNEEYLIETSNESVEQTYRNGIEYYKVAIILLNQYDYYNFFKNEDLDYQNLVDKYTKMNVIFMNFSFAYENLMKYLLLKNRLNNYPNFNKNELWGRWIYGHGIKQLYDLASIQENYKIFNFCNSFLKILNISQNLSEFKLLSNSNIEYPFVDSEYFSKEHVEWELETFENSDDQFTNEKFSNFIIENDEIFIKSRYSGQNKTNYNFLDIYYFIEGVYNYANIIHRNNGIIPENIEREYIKYKITFPKVKNIISKRYTNEEVNELMKIIKNNNVLTRLLLGPDCYGLRYYSLDEVKRLIKSDNIFQDEHYLFLVIVLGLTEKDIIYQKNQGNDIKQFIDFYNNQKIIESDKKQNLK